LIAKGSAFLVVEAAIAVFIKCAQHAFAQGRPALCIATLAFVFLGMGDCRERDQPADENCPRQSDVSHGLTAFLPHTGRVIAGTPPWAVTLASRKVV
jgi:hypothetical protein